MKNFTKTVVILLTFLSGHYAGYGQEIEKVAGIPVNYDEALSGTYALPDPLTLEDGEKVTDARQWYEKRRPQIVSLFEEFQYGKVPDAPKDLSFHVFDPGTPALDGSALRKQVTVCFTEDTSSYKMNLLIYLPVKTDQPVPVFLNLSFFPNAFVADDPDIEKGYMWGRDRKRIPVQVSGRMGNMDIKKFLSQGFGFVTVYYGDIEPDFAEGVKYGIRGHYLKEGQRYPAPDEWGAISAWSWGLSRAMDYFETDPQINSKKVAIFGASRLGKTVLWTGARDTRFAMVIASCSGEGGAALSRRWYGETIDHMTHPTRYFYQFAGNWRDFKDDPSRSPVDSHMLISLMAPRPLLLQTGATDKWSDPKGEFLAAVAAAPVYELTGGKPLKTDVFPAAGVPVLNDLGYYMHEGGHGTLPDDFDVFITFMKKHFQKD